jgi:hypothetical protein
LPYLEMRTLVPITLFDKLVLKVRNLIKIRTGPKAVARNNTGPVFQAPGGSITYAPKVVVLAAPSVPELRAVMEALGLDTGLIPAVEPQAPALPIGSGVEIVPGTAIAIIKAWDLRGSRVHLAFEVRNDSDHAVSITDAQITLNGCVLKPKQFIINNGAVRIPDPATTFPLVVEAGKTAALDIEFENLRAGPVYSMGLTAELTLEIDAGPEARVEFVANELYGLAEMLPKMQAYCDQHHSAIAFDMPIGSEND